MDQFLEHIRRLEETLFADLLDPTDPMRIKHDGYAWHYRPSHHAESGLVREEDLSKKILSVGAYPALLERILVELGLPTENIVVADSDERINHVPLSHVQFDMTEPWPVLDQFDVILFPESLCIALSNKLEQEFPHTEKQNKDLHHTDAREAELLAAIIKQALDHLNPNGVIRANGPMSHPNVIKLMQKIVPCEVKYERFLMEIKMS